MKKRVISIVSALAGAIFGAEQLDRLLEKMSKGAEVCGQTI